MQLLAKFEDRETERAYVAHERTARIPATRFLTALAIATLLSYIGFNPLHFPPEGVLRYNMAAGLFIALLLGFYGLTYTKAYIEKSWLDLIVFTLMTGVMIFLIEVLAEQAAITGITRFGMAVINLGILVVFASVGFVANTRMFFAWALFLVIAYLAFLLQADRTIVNKVYTFTNFTTFFTFACFVNWDIDRRARRTFAANAELAAEQAKTEQLLYNILPQDVAERLREGKAVADSFADVSVIFVDIVGFSQLAKTLSPGHLVRMLNTVFHFADDCSTRHGVEKVKTIGDAYLAVAGGNSSRECVACDALGFSMELIGKIEEFAQTEGIDVKVRIGIHTGPVVGGVVGSQRMVYDYWGDTMNIASRIEGIADPGGIAVSEATYYGARDKSMFLGPELLTLKGVGEVKVYRVIMPE